MWCMQKISWENVREEGIEYLTGKVVHVIDLNIHFNLFFLLSFLIFFIFSFFSLYSLSFIVCEVDNIFELLVINVL